MKRLADFDLSAAPTIQPAQLAALASGTYLDAGEPIVLLGDSGTGKSHLLIGLGLRVLYVTTAKLVNELVEAADERILSRVVARYGRIDRLLLEELGYLRIDPRGAELLFQIITKERKSLDRNRHQPPVRRVERYVRRPGLVVAIVDRVTFNAHIIETGTQSYRLRTSTTTTHCKRAN